MKPRKKLIEEATADGTLAKCDRLIKCSILAIHYRARLL